MKQLSLLILLFISIQGFSQNLTPQVVNYQAIARGANGNPTPSQIIGLRFTIHDVSQSGTIVFQEIDTVTTNQFGYFTIGIGTGTIVQGSLPGINWSTGNKYLQVELDPTGGTNYSNMGTTQMVSVPYAQNSANAGNWYDYAVYDESEPSVDSSITVLATFSWTPRYFNHTQAQSGSSISLNSNDTSILLQPGTYHITASASYFTSNTSDGFTALRIRTSPTPTTLLVGQVIGFNSAYSLATIDGVITITTASNISLQQSNGAQAFSGNGGMPGANGENNIYARILIQRIQ
jgi:hypothetical protein